MSQTNYVPNIVPQNFPLTEGPYGTGTGSPEGVILGVPGYFYTDSATGDVYVKKTGTYTTTGWFVVTGAGGGGSSNLAFSSGVVDPNGAVLGSPGDWYYNTATQVEWLKASGVATNTGWV